MIVISVLGKMWIILITEAVCACTDVNAWACEELRSHNTILHCCTNGLFLILNCSVLVIQRVC